MMEVGRVCIKTAGRDSNKYCVIVEVVDDRFVIIDGQTRKKKVNILHLEPTRHKVSIKANASKEACLKALEELGIKTKQKSIKKAKNTK